MRVANRDGLLIQASITIFQMKKQRPAPIKPDRVRKITGSFGWIDHRFVRDGFLDRLHHPEALLYFFLTAVADRSGMSWYGEDTIRRLLRIPYKHTLQSAIAGLEDMNLISFENGIFQVLSLPQTKSRGTYDEY